MKKILVAVALAMVASSASAAVAASKHDLRPLATADGGTPFPSACMYCHTPHKATNTSIAPIWARTNPSSIVVTNVFGGGANTVSDAGTKTCLTCHGTAVGIQGIGGVTTSQLSAAKVIGLNLIAEHPVGTGTSFVAGSGGMVAAPTFVGYTPGTNIECATCHDVHNTSVQVGSKLLRAYSGGDFCNACHDK